MTSNSAAPATNSAGQPEPGVAPRTGMPAPSFTDKIRAVIYPGNRGYSPAPDTNWAPHAAPPASRPASSPDVATRPQSNPNAGEMGTPPVLAETLET